MRGTRGLPTELMEIHSYKDMAEMEKENWWYRSRRAVVRRHLSRVVPVPVGDALDLGCGVGSHFTLLKEFAEEVDGVDLSPEALSFAKSYPYRRLEQSPAERLPMGDGAYDLILCADVIEHVEDRSAMKEIARVLRTNGRVVLTTPAFPSLWHENDDYSHHLRRYRKSELVALARDGGLEVEYVGYWNHLFFPIVWVVAWFYRKPSGERLSNNLDSVPAWANTILTLWMGLERTIARIVPIPFGTSLVLVARKRVAQTE